MRWHWWKARCPVSRDELSELSSATDDVTSERFGLQRSAAPQLDSDWGTILTQVTTALESRSEHRNIALGKTLHGRAGGSGQTGHNAYTAYPAEALGRCS